MIRNSRIPNFRMGCFKITFLVCLGVMILVGCNATVESKYADGSSSLVKVPMGYKWNETTKELRSDELMVQAASDAIVKIAEKSPEIISQIGSKMVENQPKQ